MRAILFASAAFAVVLWPSAVTAGTFGDAANHSTTTTQTTTTKTQSGDTTTTTTTTHTETTSHGGSWGFGTGDGHSLFGPSSRGGGFSYESLGGDWKIGEAKGNKLCDLSLEPKKFISNYGARTGVGCPEGLFGVSSWMLAGDEIRLLSPGGSVLATLHPAGAGRWNGHTAAGLEI
ncbi:MAG: AprI/Inh family metalloprotease inhibitor, partial [Alphaproteobacteria bacterium]|nr:AprI/Inh family metalloprotease inhibitor [Alphaproteobacteria bacterium]